MPQVGMNRLKTEKRKLSVWDFLFCFGLSLALVLFVCFWFPKARFGNVYVLGIKAHFKAPDVFAARPSEAVHAPPGLC